jgi:hypothetical protein
MEKMIDLHIRDKHLRGNQCTGCSLLNRQEN